MITRRHIAGTGVQSYTCNCSDGMHFAKPSPPPPLADNAPCAAVIDGERCGEPESEPPHGKMSGHKYVAPTENARAGADDAKAIADIVFNWSGSLPGISSRDIAAIARAGFIAGRARGSEDAVKVVRKEADEWCGKGSGDRTPWDVLTRIADAIAKEDDRGPK